MKKKTKVLTLSKYTAMGPRGARCQVWACRLVAGSKLLLQLLLYGHKDYDRKGSVAKKEALVGILKGFDAKTGWFAVNRQLLSNFDFENIVMGPEGARNQERLCCLGPAAIYWTGLA
jgi:hypothetical protein